MGESGSALRRLLSQRGSYPTIAAAVTSSQLPRFQVALPEHVGDVYQRVEVAAGHDVDQIAALRLTALVHEEPPESLARLLGLAGLSDFVPTVVAVAGAFGRIWKGRTEADLRDYVEANTPGLPLILLFELAHEGQAIPAMERAAEIGGLRAAFASWAARLVSPYDSARTLYPT